MEVSPILTETSPPEVPLARLTSESRAPGSPVTVDAHDEDMAPVQAEDINQAGVQMTEGQAKFYVASQCQRWKEAPTGRTVPPGTRYEWPFGKPDSQAYYLATLQTSRYLEQRMSVASQAGAWMLRVRRNTFGLALDLTGLMIPVGRLSPVECVAIIQTLLAESGFEFENVIPFWSDARISKVHSELIELVCDDLQRLLSVEPFGVETTDFGNDSKILVGPEEPSRLKATFRLTSLWKIADEYLRKLTNTMWRCRILNHNENQVDLQKRNEDAVIVGDQIIQKMTRMMRGINADALEVAMEMSGHAEKGLPLTAIHEVKDSMAQMQKTQETLMAAMSALALRDAGNMDVKEESESLLEDVRQQVAETHMETQRRQHLDEMAAFEKEFQTLRLVRDQEREANKNLQSFLVGRLKKQAERPGVYDNGLKPVPEATTQVYANSDSTVEKPVPSGVNMGVPPVLRKQMVPPEVKTLYATQTQVALRDLDETKENVPRVTAKAATTTAVKVEATTDVRKAPAEGKPRKRTTRKPDQGRKEPPKDDSKKKSTPPSQPTVKYGPPDVEPSDDDNDSDNGSGDSDSDSSSFEDLASGTQARVTGQRTVMFNPMVNITALEDFDEKQPLAARTRWLEKFQSLAVMGR
ncbi:hypothetical protein PHMEG_00029044, partial [Phytophthora megakarya]